MTSNLSFSWPDNSPRFSRALPTALWNNGGEDHLPIDIDIQKVIAVARDYGFNLSTQDILKGQCKRLAEFWQFEMENAFVARRTLFHIQYQLRNSDSPIDYYEY